MIFLPSHLGVFPQFTGDILQLLAQHEAEDLNVVSGGSSGGSGHGQDTPLPLNRQAST